MRLLPACLLSVLLLTFVSPVQACINDREVQAYEREFKSNYIEKSAAQPASPDESISPPADESYRRVVMTTGVILLASAAALGFVRKTRQPYSL
jgi:hypothetical protein